MKSTFLSLVVLFAASSMSWGSTIWHEGDAGEGDAGGLPGGANITFGVGSLTDIIGALNDSTTGADMYEIMISSPTTFSATVTGNGNNPIKNSSLYLFDASGDGEFGNDNISGANALSAIPAGTTVSLPAGLYFILVTTSGNMPAHGATNLFGDLTNTTTITAAISALKVNGYNTSATTPNPADSGKGYDIVLTGASFAEAPEPATVALIGSGLLALGFWKRSRVS